MIKEQDVIATELIASNISPFAHTDSGRQALLWMEEHKVWHCPVLKHGNFVGLLSENDILNTIDELQTLDSLFEHLPRPFAWESDHLYEVLTKMKDFDLSLLPILTHDELYLGCTTVHELIHHIGASTPIQQRGAVLVLEMNQNDYSMTQIAQIVESNQAKIVSLSLHAIPDSTKIELTIKLNEEDVERIVRTFLRFDYTVKSTHQKSELTDDLQYRFDSLMHFINV